MGRRRSAPPPRRSGGAPPPARSQNQSSGGSFVGMMASTMMQGMGWGAGSSIGRSAVGAIMGGSSEYATSAAPANEGSSAPASANACEGAAKAFGACIAQHAEELSKCQMYADALTSCKRGELE